MKKILSLASLACTGMMLTAAPTANAMFLNFNGPWQNWSGFYFGTYFGAGSGDADTKVHDRNLNIFNQSRDDFFSTAVSNAIGVGKLSGDITGSKADLFVGYNFQPECANFLFGAQLEGSYFSDITFKTKGNRAFTTSEVDVEVDGDTVGVGTFTENGIGHFERFDELRSMFSFVARGGVLIAPPMLLYVLAGATEGNFVVPGGEDSFGARRNKWETGYTLGLGLEYKITENWFLRAEYRYLHFDINRKHALNSTRVQNIGTATTPPPTTVLTFTNTSSFTRSTHSDFDFSLGQIGIVYRF